MSFVRFFNHHETQAAEIDWNSPNLKIQDKVDGSLIRFWKDPQTAEIRFSSRNCVDAGNAQLASGRTLGELIKEIMTDGQMNFVKTECEKHRTVVCELWHPDNQVVCAYKTPGLWLLAVFNNETYQEISLSNVPFMVPNQLIFKSLSEVLEKLRSEDDLERDVEGYVVSDGKNRIKIKSLRYTTRHQIGFKHPSRITDDDIVKAILMEVSDDIPGIEEKVMRFKEQMISVNNFLVAEKVRMESYPTTADYFRSNKKMGKLAGSLKKFQSGVSFKEILLEKNPAEVLRVHYEHSL
jgi:hypothetical protein